MNPRLPRGSGAQIIDAIRGRPREGSHHFIRHGDGRSTVVPVHAGETMGPGLLSKILQDVELSREEFTALL
ncbi:MAG: type II toxin-antitoxin system HicA family toxin [Xanthomonadales bacterium]|nr:type II toxin-antitoxin system HicA family toxin [Xanthomonadales bacterium]